MMRLAAVLSLILFVAGCEAGGPQTPGQMAVGARPSHPTFATQIAGPNTYLAPMPTAVVVLKPEDMARNRAFCAAFTKLPTVQEELAKSVVAPNLIQTRWLTQLSEMPPDRVRDCEYLVGTYDYARAAKLLASIQGSAPLTGRGPFLLLMVPDSSGVHIAGVDGSNYATENFDSFVASWGNAVGQAQTQITTQANQPGLVRSVFQLIFAVLRTVFGGAGGLVQGVVAGL